MCLPAFSDWYLLVLGTRTHGRTGHMARDSRGGLACAVRTREIGNESHWGVGFDREDVGG